MWGLNRNSQVNPKLSSVRAGGLGLSSRDFQSPRLKLTPISPLHHFIICLRRGLSALDKLNAEYFSRYQLLSESLR